MSDNHTQVDQEHWHRHFAVECNNRSWDLAVQSRSSAQDAEMLNAAHASAFHWGLVGDELNRMRATMLLAEVHALLGLGSTALGYAAETCDFFLGRETLDWEVAFAHVIHSHAAFAADEPEQHQVAYAEALTAMEAIESPADRAIVEATFKFVPAP